MAGKELRIFLQKAAGRAGDLLYPRRCAICDTILKPAERYVCTHCRRGLPLVRDPRCMKCGRELTDDRKEYCRECRRTQHLFSKGGAPLLYKNEVVSSLMRFKYGNRPEYASFYAQLMEIYRRTCLPELSFNLLVPVPIHRSRLLRRGYNQAALIAGRLSQLSGIPMEEHLIERIRKTKPQKGLSRSERRENLKGAFQISKEWRRKSRGQGQARGALQRILLIDDIYTTGSTMDALSQILLREGAEEIFFLCAAIVSGESEIDA